MFSIFFTNNQMLKFRYEMKDLYVIQEDLKIDLRKLHTVNYTTEQLVQLTYVGLKNEDISYGKFIDLADKDFSLILSFAVNTLIKDFSYIPEEDEENNEVVDGEDIVDEDDKQDENNNNNNFIDIKKLLNTSLRCGMETEKFWRMTPQEVYMNMNAFKISRKERSDFEISLHYLTAFLQRTKKMPPLSKFVTKKKKQMTDKQMFEMVERINAQMNKE